MGDPNATFINDENILEVTCVIRQEGYLILKPRIRQLYTPSCRQWQTKAGVHCSSRPSCPKLTAEKGRAEGGPRGKEKR